jgi:hypothetical protein
MKKYIWLMALALVLSGCASAKEFHRGNNAPPKLNPNGSAYILLPTDAMYYTKVCIGSGNAIAQEISSAFSKRLMRVEVSNSVEDLSVGLNKAKSGNFTYLVSPKINRWEDHVTEWNGELDRIQMEITIYDVQTDAILDSIAIEGNGTWFTFGGYHPQNIVRKLVDEYSESLFGPERVGASK